MNKQGSCSTVHSVNGLEVIGCRATSKERRATPLLFVHGAFSAAYIWAPFFLPYFAERGYDAYALSLRGHGGSGGPERLATARLKDYVEDVASVAEQFDTPPIVVGTSMGGVVAQKYIERYPATGAILMGSGPPHGMLMSAWWMMLTNPQLVLDMTMMQWLGPNTTTVASARRALFRSETPDEYIRRWLPAAEPESALVMFDLLGIDLPSSTLRVDVPVLVLGGGRDAFISQGAVRATASRYRTKAVIFPDMPHAMMLDPEWGEIASYMRKWLDSVSEKESLEAQEAA
jgi:non-heme chloroperoxidase